MTTSPFFIYDDIIKDLREKNTLLVLSKGIKSTSLMALMLENFAKDKTNLVLILNFDSKEVESINFELKDNPSTKSLQIYIINEEISQKRTQFYLQGGVYSISSSILIMDLLQKSLSAHLIRYIIINNAEEIENIMDKISWIMTVIRLENKKLITIGITEKPELILSKKNFRKIMQCLYLENYSFWPWSRYEIMRKTSEENKFGIYETSIKLSAAMLKIQKILMNIIRVCIDEVNRRHKSKNGGENIMNEDEIFNVPLWMLHYKIKDIISKFELRKNYFFNDIFNFRDLLHDLISLDSIAFYIKLLKSKEDANFESIWYICDNKTSGELNDLLNLAKNRVYKIQRAFINDDNKPNSEKESEPETNSKKVDDEKYKQIKIDEIPYKILLKLDKHPKYKAIAEVLTHIKKITISSKEPENSSQDDPIPTEKKCETIWIFTTHQQQVEELKKYITSIFLKKDDHRLIMYLKLKVLLDYIKQKDQPSAVEVENDKQKVNPIRINSSNKDENTINFQIFEEMSQKTEIYPLKQKTRMKLNKTSSDHIQEKKILEKLENELKNLVERVDKNLICGLKESLQEGQKKEGALYDLYFNLENFPKSFSQPIIETDIGISNSPSRKRKFDDFADYELYEETNFELKKIYKNHDKIDYELIDECNFDIYDKYGEDGNIIFDSKSIINGYDILITCTKNSFGRMHLMKTTEPAYIITFDPHASLLREILLYQAYCESKSIQFRLKEVHIIMIQNTIETAIFLSQAQKENEAFITLVKEASSLPCVENNPETRIRNIGKAKQMNTRAGQGMNMYIPTKPVILVDKREFNSPLPSRLFHDGFWIIPILLEKGDYILSNDICVERKSVETGDLLNSLLSGRLQNQISNMSQSFSKPILLIEYSEAIEFNLSSAEISKLQQKISWIEESKFEKRESFKHDIKYMLTVLCVKYPKLSIIWSKSAENTSKIFKMLKEKTNDPDLKIFANSQTTKDKQELIISSSDVPNVIEDNILH